MGSVVMIRSMRSNKGVWTEKVDIPNDDPDQPSPEESHPESTHRSTPCNRHIRRWGPAVMGGERLGFEVMGLGLGREDCLMGKRGGFRVCSDASAGSGVTIRITQKKTREQRSILVRGGQEGRTYMEEELRLGSSWLGPASRLHPLQTGPLSTS